MAKADYNKTFEKKNTGRKYLIKFFKVLLLHYVLLKSIRK